MFLKYKALDIEKFNGKYVKTEFDQTETSIQLIKEIRLFYDDKEYIGTYHGMVNH